MSQSATGFQGPMGAALSPDGERLLAASSGAARFESADLFGLQGRRRTSFTDARASRMWGGFAKQANLRPYDALRPAVTPFGETDVPAISAAAPMAAAAAKWDLDDADEVD